MASGAGRGGGSHNLPDLGFLLFTTISPLYNEWRGGTCGGPAGTGRQPNVIITPESGMGAFTALSQMRFEGV